MNIEIETIDKYDVIKDFLEKNRVNATTLIKNEHFKDILKEHINYPTIEKTRMIIDRSEHIKGFESLIGISYDYAIRFLLAHKIDKKIDKALFESIGFQRDLDKEGLLNNFDLLYKQDKVNALIDLSFKLSLNEVQYRSGKVLDFNKYPKSKLEHIYKEIEILIKGSFSQISQNFSKINFNPVFAINNVNADGDIIMDNTLIDFKVVSSLNDFKTHIDQLVVYYILSKKLEVDYGHYLDINEVQLYYPRFDYYPRFKIEELISYKSVRDLCKIFPTRDWFVKH